MKKLRPPKQTPRGHGAFGEAVCYKEFTDKITELRGLLQVAAGGVLAAEVLVVGFLLVLMP